MATTPVVENPAVVATPNPIDIHYQTVSQRVPQHLLDATPQQRQALRATLPQPMPWLPAATARLPEVIAALHDEYRRHQSLAGAVDAILAQLPTAETFAEPLLHEAIKTTFGLDLDMRRTFLFNAVRARADESRFDGGDPVAKAFQIVKVATQPLLLAALQNFEAFEAEPDGMRDDRRPSTIFSSDTGKVLEPSRDVDLLPERFAALCRTLDLGGRYQGLIESTFKPAPKNGETHDSAASDRQACFKQFEQSSLRLTLHLARLQGWIDQALYDDLLQVAKTGGGASSSLYLWEVQLNGVVLFSRPGSLVAYMPDEPQQPLQVFPSLKAFEDSLRERLKEPAWRNYFLRFVPAREQAHLLQRIQRQLYPKVWNPGGWYEERFDSTVPLGLSQVGITTPLFDFLLQRKMAVLKADGLYHAVPSATQDHKSLKDKVGYFLNIGLNVLNVAAFVVPGLGLVMLAVNAALLGYEVYEGFDSLSKGEREEAWSYFMDVTENLVVLVAMGVAGGMAHRFPGNLPAAVRGMRAVQMADGNMRLWKPDLTPFAYDVELPTGLRPGENGLYSWQGRQWLALDGRYYSVRTLLGSEPGYRLEHPAGTGAYEPPVRHNDNGGWLHELDTPEQWRGEVLFRRAGPLEAEVSATLAQRALRISGVNEAQLRKSLMDSRRPPALLSDTLRRLCVVEAMDGFSLDNLPGTSGSLEGMAFAFGYEQTQPRLSVPGEQLQRQFAGLPNLIVEEIVRAATPAELGEMGSSGRVPLRLAEEARIYQQQVRLARAREGMYLDLEANPDSACLLLHTLEGLANWPKTLRIGLYEGSLDGRRMAAIGPQQEPELKLPWRQQKPGAFCQALFDTLPGATREQLGVTDATGLRHKLQAQPLPAQRLREWLGMQVVKPAFRSPMRLADGRIGHPLSGRGTPFFTEDELLDRLRLLELDDIYVEDALQALYRNGMDRAAINARLGQVLEEMQQLRAHLDRWVQLSVRENLSEARQRSRDRIGAALWRHWRRNLLPELGRAGSPLMLERVQLADLPLPLPDFFRARVDALLLDEVMLRDGAGEERLIDDRTIQMLGRQFPALTSLDVHGGEWAASMVQNLVRAWPQLAGLGLREQEVMLGYSDLRSVAGLPRLRRLDLGGSFLLGMSLPVLDGVTLNYLGLDAIEVRDWPEWLDSSTLSRIGEVSLAGNQLTELPASILGELGQAGRATRIRLRDNPLSCQALLDIRVAEYFAGRYTFDLGIPEQVSAHLDERILERVQLQAALHSWSDDPAAPASAYRQRIARLLLGYWREDLYLPGTALLYLEDVVLADFPDNLPAFFAQRVRRLELTRFEAAPGALEGFLARFPYLAELSLVGGQPALESVPEFLTGFTQLRELALVRMGMTIDQAAMDMFLRIPALSSLQLDGNRLGEINDVSRYRQRFLDYLGMANMQIAVWPEWLNDLLPGNVELLGLDDNLLTELPARVLDNHYAADGAVDISLRNNPLSRDTLIRAYTSQHYNRPYTLTMDVPEDIAAMDARVHSSDSEAEDPDQPMSSEDDPAITWQTGDVEADARHQLTWVNLVTQGNAESLLGLVSRLRRSADYRTSATRGELVSRVWTVLDAAEQDVELRQTLDGMAEEPLQQLHNHDTCPDGIRLEFNQMELLVHTRQALRQVTDENRGPALFRLMRGVFRAQTLDRIARERARGRDEAEVRLAYRLRWGEQLELPLPPRGMLYRSEAEIAPGELDQALGQLQQEERGQRLLDFAAECDFWVAWLREAFAERFKVLKDAYESAVLEVTDLYPDDNAEQSAARIRALEERFRRDERALLERLTFEQVMAGS